MVTLKKFKNCQFNLDDKTMIIESGTTGEYPYKDIDKSQLLYEDVRFHGKSEPFTHNVLVAPFQTINVLQGKVLVGIRITMKDGSKNYIYVSDDSVVLHSEKFYNDKKEAEVRC